MNLELSSRAGTRWMSRLAVALVLGVSAFHFAASAWRSQSSGIVDFPIFAAHVASYLDTGVLYPRPDDSATYEPAAAVYKFPPLYALLLLPFVRVGIGPWLYLQHWVLQVAIYLLATAWLILEMRPRRPGRFLLVASVVVLNHEPFFENLWRQQLEGPLLTLLVAGLLFLRRERDLWTGGMIGIATMLKIYPAAMLAYAVFRRRWQILLGCLVAVVLVMTSALIVFGVHDNEVYFLKILPRMMAESPEATSENLSLGRYAQTMMGVGPVTAKHIARTVGIALLVATYLGVRKVRRPEDESLAYGAFIPLVLLVMPNSWVSYQMLLLVPLIAVLAAAYRGPRVDRRLLLPVLAASALMLFYWPCADPSFGWPCTRTPYFLGLFQWPRGFHDFMVDTRVLATILIWVASLLAIAFQPPAARAGKGTFS